MRLSPYIASCKVPVRRHFDYGTPWPVLVVGKVDGRGRLFALGQLALPGPGSALVRLTVNDIAKGLLFIRIAGTAKYLDITVVIVNSLLCQIRHKALEPRPHLRNC